MRILKEILARIFAVWGIIVFVLSLLVVVVLATFLKNKPEPARSFRFHGVYQRWMDFFFFFAFTRRKFKGFENFKKGETYIVVCNHRSLLDPPLSCPGIPYANKTIAKIEMSKLPLFGAVYKLGSVMVDRKDEASRKQSYTRMKEVLAMGLHMSIYPEGTRNKTKEPLQKFHDGAFRLSVDTKAPIIPSVIFYTDIVMPPTKTFYYWPHKVEMHFLPAVYPANKTIAELKEEVFNIMREYYLQNI
jgi:1-acyl-sn-glycerol-3-phosphate acyltransferase